MGAGADRVQARALSQPISNNEQRCESVKMNEASNLNPYGLISLWTQGDFVIKA
jgi:hypothetical protein